ncbi:MAG: hypothetical protein JW838_02240 [Spirochaetes bacterium]|nr:hypothetical protein [Spirochaetota bacterium]
MIMITVTLYAQTVNNVKNAIFLIEIFPCQCVRALLRCVAWCDGIHLLQDIDQRPREKSIMGKLAALLFVIIMAIASATGYFLLADKIIVWESEIADGQRRLDKGLIDLNRGKAYLEAKRRELSEGRERYEKAAEKPFLVFFDWLLKGGRGFKEARERIAEGDRQIARGEADVDDGRKRLAVGQQEQDRGRELLELARDVRDASALGAVFLLSVMIVLAICWRRSLIRFFTRADS